MEFSRSFLWMSRVPFCLSLFCCYHSTIDCIIYKVQEVIYHSLEAKSKIKMPAFDEALLAASSPGRRWGQVWELTVSSHFFNGINSKHLLLGPPPNTVALSIIFLMHEFWEHIKTVTFHFFSFIFKKKKKTYWQFYCQWNPKNESNKFPSLKKATE
jgi:hypothetical protein